MSHPYHGLNELREMFLKFFETKGHLRLPSFSLVPQGDNSLLLINSGMAPMKKYFTGEVTPPRTRVTTCQKCIRTPDIEQVGKRDRHGTFFEMLGNFSFGDYFKKEATAWAWEFCTKVLEMPEDKLYVTIYQDDDEAFEIWTKQNGVDPSHIVRLGKEDNFWEHGSGPCGPCSEIYFDRGEKYGCGSPDCGPGCECDRYVEFWNNVFSQFNNDGNGNYTELKQKNIDTGMGLERLACILQGVDNIFEVDTVQNIMKKISEISGAKSKGVYSFMKHFALNDQETKRTEMLCTWTNEQAMREIYLKPFEMSVKEGGAQAVMSSFNYIGNTYAGADSALLQTVLRGEGGFKGFVLTDYFGGYGYQNADQEVRAGNDSMLATTKITNHITDKSATSVKAMRQAAHNILYTAANSWQYANGEPKVATPIWKTAMYVAWGVTAVLVIGLEIVAIKRYMNRKKAVATVESAAEPVAAGPANAE